MSELDLAKRLLEFGDKPEAVNELTRILQADPNNVDAWFLMVDAVDEPAKKADCYRQILRIEGGNQFAELQLQKLDRLPHTRPFVEDDQTQADGQEIRRGVVKQKSSVTPRRAPFNLDYQTAIQAGIIIFVMAILGMFVIIVASSGVLRPPLPPTPTRIILPPTWTPMPM